VSLKLEGHKLLKQLIAISNADPKANPSMGFFSPNHFFCQKSISVLKV
jgi:hypothetical protein